MNAKRVTRSRPVALPTQCEFEINFKMKVTEPGCTTDAAAAFVNEAVRYYSAVCGWSVYREARLIEHGVEKCE